jgi:hypothetical protein
MTELIWDGKYKDGKKQGPVRIALPFQTIETVNESAQDRRRNLELFASGRDSDWRNRLIWGDKKYVLPSLVPEFLGRVNLIYIDPPFDTGADFSFTASIPDHPDSDGDETTTFTKEPSILEQKAYRDTWGRGLDSYLEWFYETVVLLRDLLTEDGSIYVHLDWHIGHYAKAILDEALGQQDFLNEIVWRRTGAHNDPADTVIIHDVIFFYTKGEDYTWNPQFTPYSEEAIESSFLYAENAEGEIIRLKKGEKPPNTFRQFQTVTLRSPHPRPNLYYFYKGYKPHRTAGRSTKNEWSNTIAKTGFSTRVQRKEHSDSRCIWMSHLECQFRTCGLTSRNWKRVPSNALITTRRNLKPCLSASSKLRRMKTSWSSIFSWGAAQRRLLQKN